MTKNRKQRNRLQVQSKKEYDRQMQSLLHETQNFMTHLYYKDIDEFFIEQNKPFHDKVNAYRIFLLFGFVYDKETKLWRTEREDLPENEMMKMLKSIVGESFLVFNYRKEEK
jgi:hypothetical protein